MPAPHSVLMQCLHLSTMLQVCPLKHDQIAADVLCCWLRHMDSGGVFTLHAGAVKAVYLAPTRALVQVGL